ncbi:MAG: hypothetical protein ACI4RK_05700, partial [Oscillospiraceae bacterium]
MLLLTFSKTGQEDIVLTEDDLFDFDYEENAYSGETFELGGVCAKSIYMMIDNNAQRFSRGTFANTRIKLEIDGNFYGYFNAELPKRRNGVIELNAYDDMVKLDVAFPSDVLFPALFKQAYAYCTVAAGLAQEFSYDNVVLNGVWDNGVITYEYNDYIYANSCRNLVSGMAEWNGGFAHINSDGKLQVDKFSKTVSREYNSGDLFEFDYSDDTVIFARVKTSQKNKTYEKGDDSGYTLVINNQYISYGLDDEAFETYLTLIYDYYNGFSLTPMSFALAEPDFQLHVGDRIQVYDEEEQVTITGNVSKIEISGNCSMKVTCGGFENVSSSSNFTPTSYNQIAQSKTEAVQKATSEGVGMRSQIDPTSEIFNCYDGSNISGKENQSCYATTRGQGCEATGFCAVACGQNCKATGFHDFCGGYNSEANGSGDFVYGYNCIGAGYNSAVFGGDCEANTDYAFVSGSHNTTALVGAFLHGLYCATDYGSAWSTILGERCTSKGESSLVCGYYLVGSDVTGSAVLGRYNDDTLYNVIFAVGNGNNDRSRSNALTLDRYGNLTIPGTLTCANIVTTDDTATASLLSDDTPTYTAQSDNVVEYDGVTYTFTVDDTGAYTGVTT